ncbi:MAG TPA: right-handed parallel beta-helix repeat-containing protein, partial [bacterium]|nr:right-handed parallel beta-helix repeat-containing protein [bacterium]
MNRYSALWLSCAVIAVLLSGSTPIAAATVRYVNDTDVVGDSWCSSIGYDTAAGTSAATPKRTITATLAACAAGDTIYVDAGIYPEQVQIQFLNGIFLIGKDSASTVIDPAGDSLAGTQGIKVNAANFVTVRDLRIQDAGTGIYVFGSDSGSFTRVAVCGASSVGSFSLDSSKFNRFTDCTADLIRQGYYLNWSNYNQFNGGALTRCSLYGVRVDGSSGNSFSNMTVSGSSSNGLFASNSDSSRFVAVTATGFTSCDLRLENSLGSYIADCAFAGTLSGIDLQSNGCTFVNNRIRQCDLGVNGGNAITTDNCFYSNTIEQCSSVGIILRSNCARNRFVGNILRNNSGGGINLNGATSSYLVQNYADSNGNTGYSGIMAGDTFYKNNWRRSPHNAAYAVGFSSSQVDARYNYFGSTDSSYINAALSGGAPWQPFRLGFVDTDPLADTVAPAAPTAVSVVGFPGGCTVAWTPAGRNEETGSDVTDTAGFRIYRSTVSDTTCWQWVGTAAATATAFADSGGMASTSSYYYRVTCYDNHAGWPNESYYSDSIGCGSPLHPGPVYYVSSDTGSDTVPAFDGRAIRPFRTIFRALQACGSGDTIQLYACANVWSESVVVTKDTIAIVGMGAARSLIRPGASHGIYASGVSGVVVRDVTCTGPLESTYCGVMLLGVHAGELTRVAVSGRYRGCELRNCVQTRVSDCRIDSCVSQIYLRGGTNNVIDSCLLRNGSGTGISFTDNSLTLSGNRLLCHADNGIVGDNSVAASSGLRVTGNSVYDCGGSSASGVQLTGISGPVLTGNIVDSCAYAAVYLNGVTGARVQGNRITGTRGLGIGSDQSQGGSWFVANEIAGATDTAVWIGGATATDTFCKNNVTTASGMLVVNDASAGCISNLTRNWWGTTDSGAIVARMAGSTADSSLWTPFRLGVCDTAANADTIAPAAPASVGCTAGVNCVRVAWPASAANEEIGGAAADLAGYRIYRAQRADTSCWRYIGQTAGTTFTDSTAAADTGWCYAVTAYDNHAGWPNESFYSAASNIDTPVSALLVTALYTTDSAGRDTHTSAPARVSYDSIWVTARVNLADSIAVGNAATGDTRWQVGKDTRVLLALAPGTNVITVYAVSGVTTACSTFVVLADTIPPTVGSFTLGGRVHCDAAGGRYSTDSATLLLLSGVSDSSAFMLRVGEDSAYATGSDTGWRGYSAALTYAYATAGGTVTLFVRYSDSNGNFTTRTATVVVDTTGPALTHTPLADSQPCNDTLSVGATLNDASGTMAVAAAFLWYRNTSQYAGTVDGWDSTAMTRQGATANWAGDIPAAAIGQYADPLVEYCLSATDTFGRTSWYMSTASPDSFTTDSGLSATVYVSTLTGTQPLLAGGGVYVAAGSCSVAVFPSALTDSITIAYYRGSVLADTYQRFGLTDTWQALPALAHGTNKVVVWLQDSGPMPRFWRAYTVSADTMAPVAGVMDTTTRQLAGTTATCTFTAQDSMGVATLRLTGDLTADTRSYTGGAVTLALTAGEGWKSIWHTYADSAGNNATFGDSLYVDRSGCTVQIQAAAHAAGAAWSCTGTVRDNGIDTPATVAVKLNGADTGTAAVTGASGIFSCTLVLRPGLNLVRVTATDSAGNASYDEFSVFRASTETTVVAGTQPVTVQMSDTAGGSVAIDLGGSDTATVRIPNQSGSDTATITVD